MLRESKIQNIDGLIRDHRDLLLANFGIKGITRSKFKEQIVMDIIDSLAGNLQDNIVLFFERLLLAYCDDNQFKPFLNSEIKQFINEEQGYIMAKTMMSNYMDKAMVVVS